jgi:hypothetical protein
MNKNPVIYTTFVMTRDGKVYDLGLFQFPPRHHDCVCDKCFVINAWAAPRASS